MYCLHHLLLLVLVVCILESIILQDTSFPMATFIWHAENLGKEELDVSIVFTFKNGRGVREDSAGGCFTEAFQAEEGGAKARGVTISQNIRDMKCSYGIAAKEEVRHFSCHICVICWILKASVHSFKQFTSRLLKLSFSLSLCTYITRMDVMLDFICMGPVDLTGACLKRQNTKWKIPCPQWDSNPQPLDSKSDALPTELAGLGECCPFKWPYYIHVLPILMFTLLYVPEWWSRA